MRFANGLLALCLAYSASFMPGFAEDKELKFSGCTISSVAYMKEMAKAYRDKYGVSVEVGGGGVPVGIRKTLSGECELGGSCRHLLPHEVQAGAVSTVIGYDKLVFIVNPSNPVSNLTLEQIKDVFSGKVDNWKALGGPDQTIAVVGREPIDAGVSVMFNEMVMKGLPVTDKNRVERESTALAEKEVEVNPSGIAVTGISSAKLRHVKILAVNGVQPGKDALIDKSYPLVRPLYLVTKGKPQGETKRFLDFVLSKEGQEIVAKNAFSIAEHDQAQPHTR